MHLQVHTRSRTHTGAGKAESRRCLCAFRERRYLSRKTYLEIESAGAGLWIATQL